MSTRGDLLAAGKTSGRMKIPLGEGHVVERRGGHLVRRDDGIGFAALQIGKKLFPRPRLDIAGRVEFQAYGAREIDVETDKHAVLVVEIEGREIAVGQEADDDAARRGFGGSLGRRSGAKLWRNGIFCERRSNETPEGKHRDGDRHSKSRLDMQFNDHVTLPAVAVGRRKKCPANP